MAPGYVDPESIEAHAALISGHTRAKEQIQEPCLPPPGSLPWYHALIDRVAASEKQAIVQKMQEYGIDQDAAAWNAFALLRAVSHTTGSPTWQVWQIGAQRHWGAMQRILEHNKYQPDQETCKLLVKRALDLLGYTYQAIALCDLIIHEEEQPSN